MEEEAIKIIKQLANSEKRMISKVIKNIFYSQFKPSTLRLIQCDLGMCQSDQFEKFIEDFPQQFLKYLHQNELLRPPKSLENVMYKSPKSFKIPKSFKNDQDILDYDLLVKLQTKIQRSGQAKMKSNSNGKSNCKINGKMDAKINSNTSKSEKKQQKIEVKKLDRFPAFDTIMGYGSYLPPKEDFQVRDNELENNNKSIETPSFGVSLMENIAQKEQSVAMSVSASKALEVTPQTSQIIQQLVIPQSSSAKEEIQQPLVQQQHKHQTKNQIQQEQQQALYQQRTQFQIQQSLQQQYQQQIQRQLQEQKYLQSQQQQQHRIQQKQQQQMQMKQPTMASKKEELSRCSKCVKDHPTVQMLKINTIYLCGYCVLKLMNPFSETIEVLCDGQLYESQNIIQKSQVIQIPFKLDPKYLSDQDLNLEIRCVQLTEAGLQEITYPQSCVMLLNGKSIKQIKPLQLKSCLHKRKDHVTTIKNVQYLKFGDSNTQQNVFQVRQTQSEPGCRYDEPGYLFRFIITLSTIYLFGLFLVKQMNTEKLIKKIELEQQSQSIDYFVQKIKNQHIHDDLSIEEVKVQLICQLNLQLINIPTRGKYCSHLQCFSLENFLHLMRLAEHKRWRCIICKQICYELEIDKLQLSLVQKIRNLDLQITELNFTKEGQLDLPQDILDLIYSGEVKPETIEIQRTEQQLTSEESYSSAAVDKINRVGCNQAMAIEID